MGGNCAMGFAAVRAAGAATRASRCSHGSATRKRGGLSIHLAAGVVELVFEAVDLLPQRVALLPVAIAVPIRPFVLAPPALDFALLPFELGDQLVTRRGAPARLHASVMPRSPMQYKKETLKGARRRPPLPSVTR
jgi:hypothetical protein